MTLGRVYVTANEAADIAILFRQEAHRVSNRSLREDAFENAKRWFKIAASESESEAARLRYQSAAMQCSRYLRDLRQTNEA